MEWLFLCAVALFVISMIRAFPELLAPRCPVCGMRLEPSDDVRVALRWNGWAVSWRKFVCPQCFYRRELLRIVPLNKDLKNEACAVHRCS